MSGFQRLREGARRLQRDAMTLWFACRHPGTPWTARALAAFVVAYALSPIDLIPDFIPVLGYLDDLLLLPALIWLALRLIPRPVVKACRQAARDHLAARESRPRSRLATAGAIGIVLVWLALAAAAAFWLWPRPSLG